MRASYNWLRTLVPELDATPQEMGERLTRSGLEVEELIEFGAASPSLLVAEVCAAEPHPDRERLTLVTVDRGGAKQTVVCGAPNVPAPGGRVALAPLGTVLPAVGLTVAPRAIGGITSEGMLCSEEELGLVAGAGKGEGIMILEPGEGEPGTPLSQALVGSHDWIFDIGVTPNRPDALSHVGIARDLATLFEVDLATVEAMSLDGADGPRASELCNIDIDDTERCPHYGGAVVLDVAVAPSPRWVRYRLESLGIRAIANVVDATNLLLLETGHPTHAFDLDKLPAGRVLVRRASEGEQITTLDGVERSLSADDLLITDGTRPVALAGVMGGENTEIAAEATRVLLECAYFAPRGIRRTARRHGLHSEASHRFERGCDPGAIRHVLGRGVALITELCGGKAAAGAVIAGVELAARPRIRLRRPKMVSLLGVDVSLERAQRILGRLGCEVSSAGADELSVSAPSFRPDLQREEDLVEEVMRIGGLDQVPVTSRALVPLAGRSQPNIEERVRRRAAALGLHEALTYGFVAPRDLEALAAPAPAVQLKNPLSEERSVMRTSLLPGLLEALRRARRHGVLDVRLFTVGRRFLAPPPGEVLPDERPSFAAVLAGAHRHGLDKPAALDVYDAKGIGCELVERVTLQTAKVEPAAPGELGHLHPRAAGWLWVGGERVGSFGQLHPDVVDRFDLDGEALVIEVDLTVLEAVGRTTPQFRPVPVLPPVTRDLALLVSAEVQAGALAAHIGEVAGELCETVELFDRFTGKGIDAGQQSLAFHMVFRDPKAAADPDGARTLTDKEVDVLTSKVVKSVRSTFGATVRGG